MKDKSAKTKIDSNILDFDNIEIGDTITISDMNFNPPLMVSARVGYLETSKSDKNNNKANYYFCPSFLF